MAAKFYCGPTNVNADEITGGGLQPTRLIAPFHDLAIVGLGRELIALHVKGASARSSF